MKKKNDTEKISVKKKRKKLNLFNFLVFVFMVYFVYTFCDQQIQINNYDSKIETYRADIESKEQLVEYYKSKKTNIETDEYIEDVARENLGYVKPYEKIFVDVNK